MNTKNVLIYRALLGTFFILFIFIAFSLFYNAFIEHFLCFLMQKNQEKEHKMYAQVFKKYASAGTMRRVLEVFGGAGDMLMGKRKTPRPPKTARVFFIAFFHFHKKYGT